MKAKLWKIKFSSWWSVIVNARNIKEAISKSLKIEDEFQPKHKLSDITEVEFIAEED